MHRPLLSLCVVMISTALSASPGWAQPVHESLTIRSVDPISHANLSVADPPRRPRGRTTPQGDPFEFLSSQSLLDTLEELTSIRPHLGWRNSTTIGEAEAMSLVEDKLSQMSFLTARGLHTWRQSFRTFTGVEFWETTVSLERNGTVFVAPADGAPGHRDRLDLAMRIDSDGQLNDRTRDPVTVVGRPLLVRSADQIYGLSPDQVSGRIVLLDYAVIDRSLMSTNEAVTRAWTLVEKNPAAVVMITQFSNQDGESHGAFVGDFPAFTWVEVGYEIPVLSLKIETLEPAGMDTWSALEDVDQIEVTWDVDLFAPGDSQYLVARIPGRDPSRAIILGAHIDSSNTPGAFDDGSGSSALLEVARVLNRAWVIPDADVILAWFGSHERGLYGSSNFTAHNSDLLDRTIAMLQMDCLGHPLDGIVNDIWLETWSYEAYGDGDIPWPAYLQDLASDRGIPTRIADVHFLVSDNSSFSGYGVPNANMIFMNPFDPVEVHYGNHLHDPYDDMDLARLEGEAFEDMATVMLTAATQYRGGRPGPQGRTRPRPSGRFHRESYRSHPHVAVRHDPVRNGMTWEGYDVDMIPYGEPVTAEALRDADLVVALPVHDYPTAGGDLNLYDESWQSSEVDVLDQYVAQGGTLVLTTSVHRLKYSNYRYDENEDRLDVNDLAGRFGVTYRPTVLQGNMALTTGSHSLVNGVSLLRMASDNGLALTAPGSETLAVAGAEPAAVLVEHGAGAVVALADLGMLGATQDPPTNLNFWRNLAHFAR